MSDNILVFFIIQSVAMWSLFFIFAVGMDSHRKRIRTLEKKRRKGRVNE